MTARKLKEKYIDFFVKKSHRKLPNVSLIPENDPTALFINSGMHPLVPYLLGEVHPLGKRLVSNQRCLRTQDIDQVGNMMHLTFFEMLGNWSLGDYWKRQAIQWSWEFLTRELRLDPGRISVTCFAGDKDAPQDEEAAKIWQQIGVPKRKIYFLGKKDNWWAVGDTGPCGPDTEMFYDTGKKKCGPKCRPGDNCGKYFEMWNDVFMEYNRLPNGKLEKLKQQNIDTGMGVERTTAMLQGKDDVYETELFDSIIQTIEKISKKKYQGRNKKPMRIIADHLRAATFAIADGVTPSNVEAGYVVRRLIRRATFEMQQLPIKRSRQDAARKIGWEIVKIYSKDYPHLKPLGTNIDIALTEEIDKFETALNRGIKFLMRYPKLDGKVAFDVFQTYGIPFEVTQEIAAQRGEKIKREDFEKEFKKHQKISRAGRETKFAGGLADHSAEVTKLHTATHLLHQALRGVLGNHVQQGGSNITPERLRFDFTHPEKLSGAEIKQVEDLVNKQIKADLPVKMKMMTLAEAKKRGALAFFGERYGEKVKVYSIGDYSKEVCGGPHVSFTGNLGKFKIVKEEAAGAGVRRIYATLS